MLNNEIEKKWWPNIFISNEKGNEMDPTKNDGKKSHVITSKWINIQTFSKIILL